MRKKLLATILTCTMILATMGTTAFAATDAAGAATDPQGTTTVDGDGKVVSQGQATMIGDTPDALTVTGDDDAAQAATDTEGKTDINIWAKVLDASTPLYKVDVAWGAMKFEYNSGAGQWNTTTHTYDTTGVTTAAWKETGYLDGTNNKITVTNHSNADIDTEFAFVFDNTGDEATAKTAFNDNPTSNTAVKGNFFADNDKAKAAALILNDNTAVTDILADSKITVATADNNEGEGGNSGLEKSKDVYFAFSGTPDDGKGAVLNTFQKVGVITLTIAAQTA